MQVPSDARQSATATGVAATGSATIGTTRTGVLMPAKETCLEGTLGFAHTVSVQNDASVERMLNINDDSKWEQHKEAKSAKVVRNALLDNKPLEARSVLFFGDLSVDEDGKHQPMGISLLELVQRIVEIVYKTRLRTSKHRSLIRNKWERESMAWYVVNSRRGAKHMREKSSRSCMRTFRIMAAGIMRANGRQLC